MAIYHCSISNVSRAKGSSSCATLSYISAQKIYEERTAQTYNYGREERVLKVGTILPEYAPEEFENPAVLFNAIENYEKAENARTAKKIEVALPREFDLERQKEAVEAYIRENLTKEGYCAAYAIHNDKENNNPHAHILVANRQITPKGEWSSKRKMEYALNERGERIPRLDENGQQKRDKNGRKQWVRINAEQNPLDKKEFLQKLRKGWAEECNKYLAAEHEIDHRSYQERGIDQIPTIHEGYASREMEARGSVSDRAEVNREIREKNHLISQLSRQLKELGERMKEKARDINDRIAKYRRTIRDSGGTRPEAERTATGAVREGFDDFRDAKGSRSAQKPAGGGKTVGELLRDINAERSNQWVEERQSAENRDNKIAQRADREAERERLSTSTERGIEATEPGIDGKSPELEGSREPDRAPGTEKCGIATETARAELSTEELAERRRRAETEKRAAAERKRKAEAKRRNSIRGPRL